MGTTNNYTRKAKEIRDNFREYFNSNAGSVPWQLDRVRSKTLIFDELYSNYT